MHLAVQEILAVDPQATHVFWSAIQTFQAIKVLDASARLRFYEEGQKRVAEIFQKLTRRNTRRNYIVHGTWLTSIRLAIADQPAGYGERRRVYSHFDPDSPKSDDGSDITVPELDTTTGHVEEMIEALAALVQDITQLLAQPQTASE